MIKKKKKNKQIENKLIKIKMKEQKNNSILRMIMN